jgi:hypothetical protein
MQKKYLLPPPRGIRTCALHTTNWVSKPLGLYDHRRICIRTALVVFLLLVEVFIYEDWYDGNTNVNKDVYNIFSNIERNPTLSWRSAASSHRHHVYTGNRTRDLQTMSLPSRPWRQLNAHWTFIQFTVTALILAACTPYLKFGTPGEKKKFRYAETSPDDPCKNARKSAGGTKVVVHYVPR